MLHRCTGRTCPHFGQRTDRACLCHKTDEQVLRELVEGLLGQFDHQGCTCTFPDDDCCAFAKATATLAAARGESA